MKYSILCLVIVNFSCGPQLSNTKTAIVMPEVNEREFTAVPAPEWSDLFLRKSGLAWGRRHLRHSPFWRGFRKSRQRAFPFQ